MLLLVLRRMFSSRWMVICLLIGSIMATALVSCIPLYTDGILQRMLTKDLENSQLSSGEYPGSYTINLKLTNNYKTEDRWRAFEFLDGRISSVFSNEIRLPKKNSIQELKVGNLNLLEEGHTNPDDAVYAQLTAMTGLKDRVRITNGRMFSDKSVDGIYEVIATQAAMKDMKLLLDKVYTAFVPVDGVGEICRIKVVGVFTTDNSDATYWHKDIKNYNKSVMMDSSLLKDEVLKGRENLLTEAEWFYAYDYYKMDLTNIASIAAAYDTQSKWLSKYKAGVEMPAIEILKQYNSRAAQLKTMLWVLSVPVLIMLVFYIFMVSQLIVRHDENGIAVLKSRGASKLQIFLSYLLESSITAAIAFIIGPPLGLAIDKVLGSSNGFLEFVQRTSLPLKLSLRVYGYSFAAVVLLIITMLIPVVAASRTTIVKYKQDRAKGAKTAFWKKYFLDVVVLALSGYGLYRYNQQQNILSTTGAKASEIQIDPLLFLTSTLFVLGAGLLMLRLYPYFIRLVYWLGRKLWSPVMYVSLMQVGRSRGQEQFLMLFLILAISTGLFNANSARTINKNMEDRLYYSTGADVTLLAQWQSNQQSAPTGASMWTTTAAIPPKEPVRYYEPDYKKYSTLSGTEYATKVLQVDNGTLQTASEYIKDTRIMGIVPNEFAKIAWFRTDLLKYHWYYYLNMMTDAPRAILVSSNLRDKYRLKLGDEVYLALTEQNYIEGTIYGFIDYWPTYNPNPPEKGKEAPGLVVANLTYIQNKLPVLPYEVWIKKSPGATDKQINDDILKRDLKIEKISYANQQIIKIKNDPMLQGANGALTLGFCAAMLISLLGFLIYWIISIQGRVLQFGIFRAMGLSLARVIGMLAAEQLLVSGAAIVMGLVIGGIAGNTFIPLLQIVYSSADQVPPFRIVAEGRDYIKVYAVIATMLVIGFLTLWRLISRIRIDQAVKLGED